MRHTHLPHRWLLPFLLVAVACAANAGDLPNLDRLKDADAAINEAIAQGKLPGAVLLVGLNDQTIYRKAYGHRALKPEPVEMTPDTIFDLASLSKSVGCAPSVMVLVDQGKVVVTDPVAKYVPAFGNHGKEAITVEQLLLHRGGLIPDNPIEDFKEGGAAGLAAINQMTPKWPPGSHFAYSDVGFIVLGELVQSVSREPLDKFAHAKVFEPLGMTDTTSNPPAEWRPRIAPTQERDGHWMIGEVHDPRAYALGGVAGHAGLFSTADDLAKFCRMILHGGTLDGHRVLSEATVKLWTTPHEFKADAAGDETLTRAYGFDVDTGYSGPRGARFERGKTFGHTGFTGTSFWIDPQHKCFYVLLTNSVHPDGKGNVLALRRKVGTIVGEALLGPAASTEKKTE